VDFLIVILLTCLLFFAVPPVLFANSVKNPPPLMLARNFEAGIDVTGYLVSEKLDGVRAYWNGHQLVTRTGRQIHAPDWFTAGFPQTPLDGEIWAGRGRFSWVSGVIRKFSPAEEDWRQVTFMVFDLPGKEASFEKRYRVLRTLVAGAANPALRVVEQQPVTSQQSLDKLLEKITAEGGEGLMLKRADSFYKVRRSDDLLKVKITQDDEAVVVGYIPGEGKYTGAMGALIVRLEDGREFRIGSGFSDDERNSPPPLGSRITFAYNGFTTNGLPRFARFLRLRPEE